MDLVAGLKRLWGCLAPFCTLQKTTITRRALGFMPSGPPPFFFQMPY